MKIVLTGAEHPFALALMPCLLQEMAVRAVLLSPRPTLPEGAEAWPGDLRDPDFVHRVLEGADAVLHLASCLPRFGTDTETLDAATRGTYVLLKEAENAGVSRIILVSSLALYEQHPTDWKVTSEWKPQPLSDFSALIPFLIERSVAEAARGVPFSVDCLRLGANLFAPEAEDRPLKRTTSFAQAAEAILQAISASFSTETVNARFRIEHVLTEERPSPPDLRPWQEILAPRSPIPSRPIQRVAVFGAGGPVGAELTRELAPHYGLRLTDLRDLNDIHQTSPPQSPGAPKPEPVFPPHEAWLVDIRSAEQVYAACSGMDALINVSVVRQDSAAAFLVNTLGAFHLAKAAVQHRIRRVIQTGPQLLTLEGRNDYAWDFEVAGDAPLRPGLSLYGHSKFLGQEILSVFALEYGLEVPVLLYDHFVNVETEDPLRPMALTWRDSVAAIRKALEVPAFPSPYEVMHLTLDLPHRKFSGRQAEELLGWKPTTPLDRLWKKSRLPKSD